MLITIIITITTKAIFYCRIWMENGTHMSLHISLLLFSVKRIETESHVSRGRRTNGK
jgi:hypothetical protein